MTDLSATWLALIVPIALALAAAAARLRPAQAWRIAGAVAIAAPLLALFAFPALPIVGRVMLLLVTSIGAVTLRFSERYLNGEPSTAGFVHWFLLTVTGASVVVIAQDLVVLGLGWTLTSLSLHQLLTFGPPRAGAELAAHKKFLLSRVADLVLLIAVILIGRAYGSTNITSILERAADGVLPSAAGIGVPLLAFAVILRSAQLPFHGWLIQVMEAPTPVSALLHAGVVNLGAYVLVALAPLVLLSPAALWMLILSGLASALLAGLSGLAQPTIKSALAWSTVAQMGFVLVEIGVGAIEVALLHIVGHACYKAHAFLASGSRVAMAVSARSTPARISFFRWVASAAIALMVVAVIAPLGNRFFSDPSTLFGTLLLAFAITPALAFAPRQWNLRALAVTLGIVLGLPLLTMAWHAVLTAMIPNPNAAFVTMASAWSAAAGFAAMLTLSASLTSAPHATLARALYPHAVAGFHLDAIFTRLTFRVWPPTLTPRAVRVAPERAHLRLERAA